MVKKILKLVLPGIIWWMVICWVAPGLVAQSGEHLSMAIGNIRQGTVNYIKASTKEYVKEVIKDNFRNPWNE